MDYRSPGSNGHEIMSATILKEVPISFSWGSSRSKDPTRSPVATALAGRFFSTDRPRKSHQFSSVTQLCPTLCDLMDCSMPGLPVHHQLLEFTQTHVHWVGDAIQPSHPLSAPSLLQSFPASGFLQMSQFFSSGDQSIGVSAIASVLPMNIQDYL